MKLDKIEIKNYKSIENATIDLTQSDNILALVGQNESGKSSILEAVHDYYEGSYEKDSLPFDLDSEETEQIVSCTFSIENPSEKADILAQIEEFLNKDVYSTPIKFKAGALSSVSDFSISFNGSSYYLSEIFENSLKNNIELKEDEEKTATTATTEPDGDLMVPALPDFLVKHVVPEIIFFEGGQCDMLPDFIAVEDILSEGGDGWIAVTWLEKCLQELTGNESLSFDTLSKTSSLTRRAEINEKVSEITADFKKDFSQRIHGIEYDKLGIEFNIEKRMEGADTVDKDYVDFGVKTNTRSALPVRMRSQGMIWFLSFWLALKSLKEKKSIILVDEPDKNLHINAQKDLLCVFEKICTEYGHQIIYTTHAPSLVPLDTIYRIFLVFNDKDEGTLCENILKTQIGNSKNKQEAISLVNYAIGCDVPHQNLIFKEKNVILEGVSDFMYLQAMTKILDKELVYGFVPGVGAKGSKLNPLVGICIGYNLNWCVILDGESVGQGKFKELKDGIFAGKKGQAEKKIKVLDVDNIEDIFTEADIKMVADCSKTFKLGAKPAKKNNVSYIGKRRKNIFASLFLEKVRAGEIEKKDIGKTTIAKYEEIFDFIEKALLIDEFER